MYIPKIQSQREKKLNKCAIRSSIIAFTILIAFTIISAVTKRQKKGDGE